VRELRKTNDILRLVNAFFAQAELGRHFKPSEHSSTDTAMPTASSQSAR
jgi:hypothetical protein